MSEEMTIGYTILQDRMVVAAPAAVGSAPQQFIPISINAQTPDDILGNVADHIASLGPGKLSAIGIAVGGHVNPSTGMVVYAPDLAPNGTDWLDVDVKSRLEMLTGLKVFIDNDVNCMVHHVSKNIAPMQEKGNLIAVYIAAEGRGLGSGIIADGNLVRGATGGAGEFGHVIVQPTGARCRCGSRGCLEALLAVENIAREINWGGRAEAHSLAQAADLVSAGDPVAISAFTRAGRNFGQGVAVLINLFNPALIVIGGPDPFLGHSRQYLSADMFQKGFEGAVQDYAFSNMSQCRIQVASLDPYVAASGAAQLAAMI